MTANTRTINHAATSWNCVLFIVAATGRVSGGSPRLHQKRASQLTPAYSRIRLSGSILERVGFDGGIWLCTPVFEDLHKKVGTLKRH